MSKTLRPQSAARRRPSPRNDTGQEICPFCVRPFEKNDLIVQFLCWEVEASERLAHPACLVRVSE